MILVDTREFTKEEILDIVQANAEALFRGGTFFCSEAVVQTLNELLGKPYDENIVKMASGFPIGMGKAGCLCGAISGGQMALGMVYGRVFGESMNEKMFDKDKGLISDEYKSTCCNWNPIFYKNDEISSKTYILRLGANFFIVKWR